MYYLHVTNSRNVERTKLIVVACLLNLKRSGHTKLVLPVDFMKMRKCELQSSSRATNITNE